jgi:hypothetical protein
MFGTDLARRKSGVQIPSPPPPQISRSERRRSHIGGAHLVPGPHRAARHPGAARSPTPGSAQRPAAIRNATAVCRRSWMRSPSRSATTADLASTVWGTHHEPGPFPRTEVARRCAFLADDPRGPAGAWYAGSWQCQRGTWPSWTGLTLQPSWGRSRAVNGGSATATRGEPRTSCVQAATPPRQRGDDHRAILATYAAADRSPGGRIRQPTHYPAFRDPDGTTWLSQEFPPVLRQPGPSFYQAERHAGEGRPSAPTHGGGDAL